jgi:hypothetical protein
MSCSWLVAVLALASWVRLARAEPPPKAGPGAAKPGAGGAGAAKPGAADEDEDKPDPSEVALAKKLGGKVWSRSEPVSSLAGAELGEFLKSHAPDGELQRKDKDAPWHLAFLAVFKRPAVRGAMTVRFFDVTDKDSIVDEFSPTNDTAALVYRASYDLSPDRGFNVNHKYEVRVGQLLKRKAVNEFVQYASGVVSLK